MRSAIFAGLFMFLASDASAQTPANSWIVAVDKQGDDFVAMFVIDADRIVESGTHRRVWIRGHFAPDHPSVRYREMITYSEFDCQERRTRILQSTSYAADRSTIAREEMGAWSFVVPESFGESAFDFACSTPAQRMTNSQFIRLEVDDTAMATSLFRRR